MGISALNTGLSGLQAYQRAIDSSANNIANASTADYQPQVVQFQEQTNGGVIANISKAGSSAATADSSGTDLATEIVNTLSYKVGFDLSAKIVKTADEILGTLIDLKA